MPPSPQGRNELSVARDVAPASSQVPPSRDVRGAAAVAVAAVAVEHGRSGDELQRRIGTVPGIRAREGASPAVSLAALVVGVAEALYVPRSTSMQVSVHRRVSGLHPA